MFLGAATRPTEDSPPFNKRAYRTKYQIKHEMEAGNGDSRKSQATSRRVYNGEMEAERRKKEAITVAGLRLHATCHKFQATSHKLKRKMEEGRRYKAVNRKMNLPAASNGVSEE